MRSSFILKVSWEVLLTPVTYAVVGWLKRKEGVDVYDVGTDFTPFTMSEDYGDLTAATLFDDWQS